MTTNPGDLGRLAEKSSPDYLMRRLADLEAKVRRVETARSLEAATIGRGGITIGDQGSLQVKDVDGHLVAIIGALPSEFNRADGTPQPGVALYREDGSVAALLGDGNPTVSPYRQAWSIFDRAGNVVMADDTNGGVGLAAPRVSGGIHLADTNVVRWPQTVSSTFVDIATGWLTVQNPRLSWDINMVCDASTSGQVRLLVNSAQVDTTQTVGTSFVDWYRNEIAIPGNPAPGNIIFVQLQARRVSGTGGVYAISQRFEGDSSP